MGNRANKQRMTVTQFFANLASNEELIFAVAYTNSFKKNVKLCYKQNLDLNELYNVIVNLAKFTIYYRISMTSTPGNLATSKEKSLSLAGALGCILSTLNVIIVPFLSWISLYTIVFFALSETILTL